MSPSSSLQPCIDAYHMKALQLAALVVAACIAPTEAIWPFKKKRFEAEAFIDAGPLGMEAVTGRVVAVGDWDGDQK